MKPLNQTASHTNTESQAIYRAVYWALPSGWAVPSGEAVRRTVHEAVRGVVSNDADVAVDRAAYWPVYNAVSQAVDRFTK